MPNWCSNRATISGPAPVIEEIRHILTSDDKATIDAKAESLMSVSQKLGEKIYAENQATAKAAGAEAEGA